MRLRCLPILALLLLAPRESRAGDPLEDFPDPGAAHALFEEARALIQQRKYDEGCSKLEASLRLEADVAAQFDLADCNEHLGKLATAWAGFLDVAGRSKDPSERAREKTARRRASAIEPRLPKLVIDVPSTIEGLEVRRDGAPLDAAQWGAALPVDPGTHRVTAWAPGKTRWLMMVEAHEASTARVEVPHELDPERELATAQPTPRAVTETPEVIPAAAIVAPTPKSSPTPNSPATLNSPPTPNNPPTPSEPPTPPSHEAPPRIVEGIGWNRPTVGWGLAGLGLVGVGLGAGFAFASLEKHDVAAAHCRGDVCDAIGASMRDAAIRNGDLATISTVAGAAALAGGLFVTLTAPKRTAARRTGTTVHAAPGAGSLVVRGAF